MGKVTDIPIGTYNCVIVLTESKVEFPINLNYINFLGKVDTKTLEYISDSEDGYEESTLPTINDLLASGQAKDRPIVRQYDVDNIKGFTNGCRNVKDFKEPNFKKIAKEFRDNGFDVTVEALQHNFYAWVSDEKSGYRDLVNDYHLFTPCGCNPLSFRATELCPYFADWQTTYSA